jgi:DNA polymerase-1
VRSRANLIPLAFDTETERIRPACLAPRLVCVTYQRPGAEPQIVNANDAEPLIRGWLLDTSLILVGQNVAYDLGVIAAAFPHLIPLIFAAYDADRITDTMIRAWLLDTAAGALRGRPGPKGRWIKYVYDLESLASRCAGMKLQKDGWRMSYGRFLDAPLSGWVERARQVQAEGRERLVEREATLAGWRAAKPKGLEVKALEKEIEGLREMVASSPEQCLRYPLDDARATLAVYLAQEKHARPYLADQYRQARAYFALHLQSAWGLRTDEHGVEVLRRETKAELDEIEEELKLLGLVKPDGVRDTKRAKARMIEVCRRDGLVIPRTDAHERCEAEDACEEHVCLDADACEATEDDVLMAYSRLSTLKKILTNDIEALSKGVMYPVHTRYGFAATGRTTSSKPNIQNQSKREGMREAFIPREGMLFAECDYPQLELYCLAQCCMSWLGRSKLADVLNSGLDPHLVVAARILGMTYEEAKKHKARPDVDKARAFAKIANFGFPGGLGIDSTVSYARKSMLKAAFDALGFNAEVARMLKETWLDSYPEMSEYFARVNGLIDEDTGRGTVETLFTGRIRGGATYCAACNCGFQALGSDCAKRAAWLIARACYAEPRSPLFGSRPVAFVHDEFILEVANGPTAHDAAYELARLMVEGANPYLPDVPIPTAKMEPVLMTRWSKWAKTVLDANGRLTPWLPKESEAA